jgi:thiamine monophosphate synthase
VTSTAPKRRLLWIVDASMPLRQTRAIIASIAAWPAALRARVMVQFRDRERTWSLAVEDELATRAGAAELAVLINRNRTWFSRLAEAQGAAPSVERGATLACGFHTGLADAQTVGFPRFPAGALRSLPVHDAEEVSQALAFSPDLLIASPILRAKGATPARGLAWLIALRTRLPDSVQLAALGGVTPSSFADVLANGADMACVLSGLYEPGALDRFRSELEALTA